MCVCFNEMRLQITGICIPSVSGKMDTVNHIDITQVSSLSIQSVLLSYNLWLLQMADPEVYCSTHLAELPRRCTSATFTIYHRAGDSSIGKKLGSAF